MPWNITTVSRTIILYFEEMMMTATTKLRRDDGDWKFSNGKQVVLKEMTTIVIIVVNIIMMSMMRMMMALLALLLPVLLEYRLCYLAFTNPIFAPSSSLHCSYSRTVRERKSRLHYFTTSSQEQHWREKYVLTRRKQRGKIVIKWKGRKKS